MRKKKYLFLTIIFLLFSNIVSFSQCAMCRSAVESTMSNGRNNSAIGLNTGILYLLLAPYILVGTIGFFWYRTSKKNRIERIKLEMQLKQAFLK